MKIKKSSSHLALIILSAVFLLGTITILPLLQKIPSHPDEHQFYLNVFRMMGGKELQNYLHVAFVEYALTGFFYFINLFTSSGVNFPQGEPSMVTQYYGKVFSFIFYILSFILGSLILQRGEKKIKIRTIIFAVLYFSSIGIFERFLRVNSDSMGVFVFLNYLILSLWFHKRKASEFKFFLLNLFFIFLCSFTNLKALYLAAPIAFLNTIGPFLWYENDNVSDGKFRLPKLYRFFLYCLGIFFGGVYLWTALIPRPFNDKVFWYGLKNTIVHGAKFDFIYPVQAFGSWKVYIYDLLMEYIGLTAILAMVILTIFSYFVYKRFSGQNLFKLLLSKAKSQININYLKSGELQKITELILLLTLFSYYVGVSMTVIHWSRWGVPLGFLAIMILGTVMEKVIEPLLFYRQKIKISPVIYLPLLFLLTWTLRFYLDIDLKKSAYFSTIPYQQVHNDVAKFLKEKDISPEKAMKEVVWIAPYSYNVGTINWDLLVNPSLPIRKDIRYILWPSWNIAPVYTKKNVDLSTHNQRALIEQMTDSVEYRFPTYISKYIHFTKLFAWKYLGLTWTPEVENMIEPEYAVLKLKEPLGIFKVNYSIPFKDMTRYYFPHSWIFNIKNLPDGYMFPPCYGYTNVRYVDSGLLVDTPPEFGTGGRTAGLYCHNTMFRILFRGDYIIRIEGLPVDVLGTQKVLSNQAFNWDPGKREISISVPDTMIAGEFGVATKERYLPNLKFVVDYLSPATVPTPTPLPTAMPTVQPTSQPTPPVKK